MSGTKRYDPPRNGEGDQPQAGGGGPRILQTPIKQVKSARILRRQMSLPEVIMWQVLRKRPAGLKFRRQFPGDRVTVDFACLEHRLIIEVDGEGHGFGDQPRRDAARDAMLTRDGFTVVRIAAQDVLTDMDAVLGFILAACADVGPLHRAASRRGPPPRSGEDLS